MEAVYQHDKRKVSKAYKFVPLIREELLALTHGSQVLCLGRNGKMHRCRVTGKVKTWKTNAALKIPICYGLRDHSYAGLGLTSVLTLYREVE